MGHDISGYNKAGDAIAYARFSMWNDNATILYRLLEAGEYYAGVSGSGGSASFSKEQLQRALLIYYRLPDVEKPLSKDNDFHLWDMKQILEFLQNCFATAEKEGSVTIYFG